MKTTQTASKQRGLFWGSFSVRLTLYVLLIVTALFVVALATAYHTARRQVQQEVVEHAQVALDHTILQISTILQEVEQAVADATSRSQNRVEDPEALVLLTEQLLATHPDITGSAIAFPPHYFPEKGRYYAPYLYREGDRIIRKQLGSETYRYHEMAWYRVAMERQEPYWCEPYYDRGGAERLLTTYAYPLRDATGEPYAVLTADLSIEAFAEQVKAIKPYPDAYNFMISRQGAFLAHSRHEALLSETIFENAERFREPELATLAKRMVSLERGVALHRRNGVDYYVLFAPVANTGWSVAVVCPYTHLFSGVYSLRSTIVGIFGVGVVLIVGLCYLMIRRLTRPLKRLTRSATEIAAGEFSHPIPEVAGRDEMRQLRDSFEHMRLSLITYIEELRTTTAQKERMASDLRVAREIQRGMLPTERSLKEHQRSLCLASRLLPAREVGGDLYHYFIQEGQLYFIIGDVSGKGVPAALVMAVLCRMFRTVAPMHHSPAEILGTLNRVLAEQNEQGMFCTALVGILNLESGQLRYANAGHNPPLLCEEGGKASLLAVEPNIPLGVLEEFSYTEGESRLAPKSHLLLYTDGVTEATNAHGELFGQERLLALLTRYREEQPESLVEALLEAIREFTQGCEQSDDIAILDLMRTNGSDA